MRSLTSVIRREVTLLVLLIVFVELCFGVYETVSFARIVPQLMFRDAGAYIATRFVPGVAARQPMNEVFEGVVEEVQRIIPNSELQLYSAAGNRILHSTGCSVPLETLEPRFFENFKGFSTITYPISPPTLCSSGEEFLSAAPLFESVGSPMLFLTRRSNGYVAYMLSLVPMLRSILAGLISVLFFFAWTRVCSRLFRGFLFGEARAITERVKRFADGKLDTRLSSGEFPEYEELAEAFNSLAEETSERLTVLRDEEIERRELMAGLAHDLRTPMTAIEGSIALLERSDISNSKHDEYAQLIRDGSHAQAELASMMTQLALLDDSTKPDLDESISPEELFHEAVRLAGPIAEQKNVTLVTSFESSSRMIRGNGGLVRRALLNFLDNAIRHSPTGSTVTSTLRFEQDGVYFEVKDEGAGVIKEAAGETRKRPGLGLKIVERISGLHQGKLQIGNAEPRGTAARLWLPFERADSEVLPQLISPVIPEKRRAENFETFLATLSLLGTGLLIVIQLTLRSDLLGLFSSIAAFLIVFLTRRAQFGRFPGGLIAMLCISVVVLSDHTALTYILSGFAFQGALAFMTTKSRGIARLIIGVLCFALFYVGVENSFISSMFLLGVGLALWITGIFWLIESTPYTRRAGIWIGGLLLIGAGTASFMRHASFYYLTLLTTKDFAREEAERMAPPTVRQVKAMKSAEEFHEAIISQNFLNPMVDLVFFDELGILSKPDPSELKEVYESALESSVRSGLQLVESQVKRVGLSFRRMLDIQKVCLGTGCLFIGFGFPGLMADAFLHREITNLLMPLVVFELCFLAFIMVIFGARWQRLIGRRFDAMKEGVRRYRRRDYQTPIGVEGSDEFALLAQSLDSLAERVPEIEREILEKRKRQRRLLLNSSAVIRRGTGQVAAGLPQDGSRIDGVSWKAMRAAAEYLRRSIENIFEITYIERGELRQVREEISISELLLEELETFKRKVGDEINFELRLPKHPFLATTVVEPLIGVLQTILMLSVRRGKPGAPIGISLEARDTRPFIEISDCSPPFPMEIIQGMLSPFEGESVESEDVTPENGAFSIALLARKLELAGGRLEISPRSDGMTYGIFV